MWRDKLEKRKTKSVILCKYICVDQTMRRKGRIWARVRSEMIEKQKSALLFTEKAHFFSKPLFSTLRLLTHVMWELFPYDPSNFCSYFRNHASQDHFCSAFSQWDCYNLHESTCDDRVEASRPEHEARFARSVDDCGLGPLRGTSFWAWCLLSRTIWLKKLNK